MTISQRRITTLNIIITLIMFQIYLFVILNEELIKIKTIVKKFIKIIHRKES